MKEEIWNQGKLLEYSGWYWRSCTLHAGVKLGVFTAIGDKGLKSNQVAQVVDGDKKGVEMLLNALTALGLLNKVDQLFMNTEASRKFLSKDSSDYLGFIITHHHHLMDSWTKLDYAVKTGTPVRSRVSHDDNVWRENFLMGMFNIGMGNAPRVAKEVDLSSRYHLLDLGGGPGTYAIHFCMENPQLHSTVYDLPTTQPFAEKTIARFGLEERVSFLPGDYINKEINGQYDVAWLSHILHGEGPEACEAIIGKTVAAMKPEGLIIVHDFILDNTMDGPLFPALFSLNMLLGTSEGQSYSEDQIITMLSNAGIKNITRHPFCGTNDSGIITGLV